MKYIKTVIFLFYINSNYAQNNLIHNSSFEDWDNLQNGNEVPCKGSQFNYNQVWEDDHNFIFLFDNLPCDYLECDATCLPCQALHSPDWFKYMPTNTTKYFYFFEKTANTPIKVEGIPAHSGIGYVGMGTGELIEQKFFNSNQIAGGKKYTFSMYIRIPNELTQNMQTFSYGSISNPSGLDEMTYNLNSEFKLNVYLSTQKIKYSNTFPTCNSATWHDNFKDVSSNHIVLIKSFSISPSEYLYGQWHKATFEFECPSNYQYDWLTIEQSLDTQNPNNNGYILIDDVSLVESCELSCYPTSGIPSPGFSSGGTYPGPALIISNLNNVEKAYFEIYNMLGQLISTSYFYNYTNGIDVPLVWGASSTDADGLYVVKLFCENDCGNFTFSNTFVKVTDGANSTPATKIEEREFSPCCIIDYTINNQTYNFSKSYQVKENIYVNSNVHALNNSNLNLIAGKSIEINGEFEANSNSEFSATIVECADAHRTTNNILTEKDFIYYDQLNEAKTVIKLNENSISVIPNPTNGIFLVKDKTHNFNYDNKILIFDIFGKELVSFNNNNLSEGLLINLSNFNNGIYILKYSDPDGIQENIKIIKQD